jgi:carbon monoxide dehydrogenase subunit G
MRVAGTVRLTAPADRVLGILGEPARLVSALPNVDDLEWEANEDGSFVATIRPATALGELPIRTVWDPEPVGDSGWRFRMEGRTDEHFVRMEANVGVRQEDGVLVAGWDVTLEVTGTLRSAAQRTLAAIVAAQAAAVLRAVDQAATID